MEEDRRRRGRGEGDKEEGEVGATLQLTVRTPVRMPQVLQAAQQQQQGPSVAFFPRACGTAHGAPCTARVPRSRVGKEALAQGAQRT